MEGRPNLKGYLCTGGLASTTRTGEGLGLLTSIIDNLSGELSCKPVFQAANETTDLLIIIISVAALEVNRLWSD